MTIFEDAYDAVSDVFSQDQVAAPPIDMNAANLGGPNDTQGKFAFNQFKELRDKGEAANAERQAQAAALTGQGAAAVQQGNARAATTDAMGAAGLAAGQQRAGAADNVGMTAQSNQNAASQALTQQAQGAQGRQAPGVNLGAANASAATGTQAMGGLMGNASRLGAAANTPAGQIANQGALGANAGALGSQAAALQGMAQTPQAQTANAAALGAAGQTNAAQQGNAANIRDFYQQGPGASVAEAQLRQGQQAAMASNLALARSGRGGANAGAERQALFANAAAQQDTNQAASLLRAKESDDFRNRQLQAMGLETGALGTARGQDIAGLSAQTQALGQARGQDIGAMQAATGALGQQTTALGTQGQMLGQARGQDLQALGLQTGALGQAGSLANQQQQIGAQTALGVSGQQLQQGAQNDALTSSLSGIAAQRAAAGDSAALQGMGIGNQAIGQGQQFAVGMGGLGNQSVATGQGTNVAMGGLANQASGQGYQQDLAAQGMGLSALTNQAQMDLNMQALQSGQGLQASMANAGYDQSRDAALLGLGIGALSDASAKTDIEPVGYSGMNNPAEGYRQDASMVAGQEGGQHALGGAAGDAKASPALGSSAPGLAGMASSYLGGIQDLIAAPNIPTYQAPQFAPIDANYVTSDERAKQKAYVDGQNEAARSAAEWLHGASREPPPSLVYQFGQSFSQQRGGEKLSPADMKRYLNDTIGRSEAPAPQAKPTPSKIPDSKRKIITASNETDLRPVQNFSYAYKDPRMPGAAPGRQVGPMAQAIAKSDAAPLVRQQPNGMLGVDGPRAGMVALGAAGEGQRRMDDIERRLAALGVSNAA